MRSYSELDMLANEVNFRDGSNVSRYQVEEVLDFGHSDNLERWEIEAIKREARSEGIY